MLRFRYALSLPCGLFSRGDDMAEWSLPLDRWADVQKDKINTARRIFAFEIFGKIVARTPVDKGAARQNWIVTLNSEDLSFDETKRKGGRVKSEGEEVIDSAKGDDSILIQNNAPYIGKLEYGGYPKEPVRGGVTDKGEPKTVNGFSRQAPNGMVGVTMASANQIFDKAVNAVKDME